MWQLWRHHCCGGRVASSLDGQLGVSQSAIDRHSSLTVSGACTTSQGQCITKYITSICLEGMNLN
jgi:hypothetical protein